MIVDDQIKWKLSDKECLVEWLASDWDHTSQKLTLVTYKKSVLFILPIQLIGFGGVLVNRGFEFVQISFF